VSARRRVSGSAGYLSGMRGWALVLLAGLCCVWLASGLLHGVLAGSVLLMD
jgi:hypothetical protein